MIRKIIHIDMDAFFASVEQRDNPQLQGKAIVVGGDGERGVVAAASYEARKFGVRSAMSSFRAKELCPKLIFVKPRFEAYKISSLVIKSIFKEYTDLIEPLSLDEAFLDVSLNKKQMSSATLIAKEIKKRIKEQTDLTASAGVSYNKFLAKIASDYKKPDGLFVITPEEGAVFIEQLPIERFHGIGRVTAEKLRRMGVFKGKDLKKISLDGLTERFGKSGAYFYDLARAVDERPVVPAREPKSIGAESTFSKDIIKKELLDEELRSIMEKAIIRLQRSRLEAKTVSLKIKFSDFKQITRSKTIPIYTNTFSQLSEVITQLLAVEPLHTSVRLIGVSFSNFYEKELPHEWNKQLTINY